MWFLNVHFVAFGILMWEIATYGTSPYAGFPLYQVYQLLERGFRMKLPSRFPEAASQLVTNCKCGFSEKFVKGGGFSCRVQQKFIFDYFLTRT